MDAAREHAELPPLTFVVGCARSGTSILGEVFANHPDLDYVYELHQVWEAVPRGDADHHRLDATHATPEVRAALEVWLRAQARPGRMLVEKNPRNALRIPFLRAAFPHARFVHIVRDGRDVACSLRPGLGGDSWSHLKPPGWQSIMAEHEGALRGAETWRRVVETTIADLDGAAHLQVRYEDLVGDAEATACRILDFLGLRHAAQALGFARTHVQDTTAGSYHAQHQVTWFREDHARRVGRHLENLTAAEQHAVDGLIGPLLDELGYERDPAAHAAA